MKKEVLTRVKEDSWAEIDGKDNKIIGETLTDALSYIYKKYKVRVFEVNANTGTVSIDDGKKIKKEYSLYDDN